MLTRGDDYPIHQTPEPIAFSGTDRNFYDRYFFNGYTPGGETFFAIAFGVYPHLNIADAHISIVRDGKQSSLHASRVLNMERMDISVGPIRIYVEEPLQRLRITVEETNGITADITFVGRAFPIQEPRFIWRNGPRTVMDVTRMTQNGAWSGHITLDGQRIELTAGTVGTRDRSWGVRPVGASDPQPAVPAKPPQFFWLWSPINFEDRSLFFHVNDDDHGRAWNTRAVIVPDGAGQADLHAGEADRCAIEVAWRSGTRWAKSARLTLTNPEGDEAHADFEPVGPPFQMLGIGYGHPSWSHGGFKGDLVLEREDFDLSAINPLMPQNLHIQQPVKVTLRDFDGFRSEGRGILEQLVIGPHAPSRFREILDPAG
jgi:hypothetical protein